MKGALAAGVLLLSLAASSCSGKNTPTAGLMVVLSSDGTLKPDKLHVHVASADGTTVYRNADYPIPGTGTLPATVAIASNGNPTASVLIDASLWMGGQPLDERQDQVFEIPTDRVAQLDIVFSARCTAQVSLAGGNAVSLCVAMTTCDPATGQCTNNVVHAGDLPTYTGDAGGPADDGSTPDDAAGPTDSSSASTRDSDDAEPPVDARTGADATTDSPAEADATVPADATVDASDAGDGGGGTPDGGDPEIDYATGPVTLTMSPFTVAPGAEAFECQTFADPWSGQVDVKSYSVGMSATGAASLYAFYVTNATSGAVGACPGGGLMSGGFTFATESPQSTLHYPASVGAGIAANTGLQLAVHYINTTASTLNPSVALTMYIAKPGHVSNYAGVLFVNDATISVPATCTGATGGCQAVSNFTLPQAVNILQSVSIMSQHGTNFVATSSTGPQIYTTTAFNQPTPKLYPSPLALPSGATITWTCTDVNNTGSTLTFGESTSSNVMCASLSVIYPVTDPANPVIGGGL
jgi:hypothetical protein